MSKQKLPKSRSQAGSFRIQRPNVLVAPAAALAMAAAMVGLFPQASLSGMLRSQVFLDFNLSCWVVLRFSGSTLRPWGAWTNLDQMVRKPLHAP